MFSSKKKAMKKEVKKLHMIKETQYILDKFQNVHNKVYSVKLSLTSLIDMKEEIKLQEMLFQSNQCNFIVP